MLQILDTRSTRMGSIDRRLISGQKRVTAFCYSRSWIRTKLDSLIEVVQPESDEREYLMRCLVPVPLMGATQKR